MRLRHTLPLVALLLAARPASADLITIEPDAFASGTDLSRVVDSATLWTLHTLPGGGVGFGPVYSEQDADCVSGLGKCAAVTGTHVFTSVLGSFNTSTFGDAMDMTRCFQLAADPPPSCSSGVLSSPVLLIEFVSAVDFVSMGSAFNLDCSFLIGLDDELNRIASVSGETGTRDGGYNKQTVTLEGVLMKYVIAGAAGGVVALDVLTYNTAPEPTTLLLVGIGVIGLAHAMRKR